MPRQELKIEVRDLYTTRLPVDGLEANERFLGLGGLDSGSKGPTDASDA